MKYYLHSSVNLLGSTLTPATDAGALTSFTRVQTDGVGSHISLHTPRSSLIHTWDTQKSLSIHACITQSGWAYRMVELNSFRATLISGVRTCWINAPPFISEAHFRRLLRSPERLSTSHSLQWPTLGHILELAFPPAPVTSQMGDCRHSLDTDFYAG